MIERVKSAMVGAGAGWVLWLMLALSVVSLAIMLERAGTIAIGHALTEPS